MIGHSFEKFIKKYKNLFLFMFFVISFFNLFCSCDFILSSDDVIDEFIVEGKKIEIADTSEKETELVDSEKFDTEEKEVENVVTEESEENVDKEEIEDTSGNEETDETSSNGESEESVSNEKTDEIASNEETENENKDNEKTEVEKNEIEEEKEIDSVIDDTESITEFDDIESAERPTVDEREWTILVYMSADNNLESAAISDLLEMEKSKLNTNNVTVLVLLDRNPSYDPSNGNWHNTKLYRVKTNNLSNTNEILSEEIECFDLGLAPNVQNELDMSSFMSLSRSIKFMYNHYPANHYGLIVWGHGEGWRGVCYDETSSKRMTLQQLQMGLSNGLNGKLLDFIGFDTCFGAEIEVFYEIKDCSKVAFGVEGLLGLNGMDYELLLNTFASKTEKSIDSFIESFVTQFENSYKNFKKSAICVVDLTKIKDLFLSFDLFCKESANKIDSSIVRDEIKGCLLNETNQFFYDQVDSDLYMDMDSIVCEISKSSIATEQLLSLKQKYFAARDSVVLNYWESEGRTGSLGVYFSTLTVGNYLSSRHEKSYIKGATDNQLAFVVDSEGYVPSKDSSSLLDKIFYSNL